MTLKKNMHSIQIHLQTCNFITLQLSTLQTYINTVQLNTVILILVSSLFCKDGSKD